MKFFISRKKIIKKVHTWFIVDGNFQTIAVTRTFNIISSTNILAGHFLCDVSDSQSENKNEIYRGSNSKKNFDFRSLYEVIMVQ